MSLLRTFPFLLAAGLGLAILVGSDQADEPAPGRGVVIEKVKPKWKVGDQWIVETQTLQLQKLGRKDEAEGEDPRQKPERGPVVPWQFSVIQQEKLEGVQCLKVEARCLLAGKQPTTQIWVDQNSLALRQIQTQVPVQGGFRTITESYQSQQNQGSPVIGPLSVLPLDLPLFPQEGAKSLDAFEYETTIGPSGTKAIGDVGFAQAIEQKFSVAQEADTKGLLDAEFTKSLTAEPLVEVRLKTSDRQVRQLWQANLPWPAYSDNGNTVSRLVKVQPAKN